MTIEQNQYSSAFLPTIPAERLQETVPAAFATQPYGDVSSRYVFISTAQLVGALIEAGFQPVSARQSRARNTERTNYAKHMIRFQAPTHSLNLGDAVPEIILVNAHDATSPYQVRAGLYRGLCSNGLIARVGDFGFINVPHRGNVVANVVEAAMTIMRGFDNIGLVVNQMRATQLPWEQQLALANAAARVRYLDRPIPYEPSQLLEARRTCDESGDLWTVYNVVQENLMRGGVVGKTTTGRSTRTRTINAIREDVRINSELWQIAFNLLRA
jgi:hypothetical protein